MNPQIEPTNSLAMLKTLSDLTVAITKLATTSDIQGKQVSGDISEIKDDIKEIKSNSLSRVEFATFRSTEFKNVVDSTILINKTFATKEELANLKNGDVKLVKMIVYGLIALILTAVIGAWLSKVVIK